MEDVAHGQADNDICAKSKSASVLESIFVRTAATSSPNDGVSVLAMVK